MSETEKIPIIPSNKIYEDLKLETHYDPQKEGYWLVFKDQKPNFFFQKAVLEAYASLGLKKFIHEINRENPEVLFAGREYGVAPYNIWHSFQETKKIEDGKLEKALRGEDQNE